MNRGTLVLALALGLLPAVGAQAHHSFQATYQTDQVVTIKGKLVQFLFRNPHSFVHVMAPDENGDMQRWGIEWGGASALGRQGVARDTLRVGDEVIITGNPGRNPSDHRIRMQTLVRPSDGFGWGHKPEEVIE